MSLFTNSLSTTIIPHQWPRKATPRAAVECPNINGDLEFSPNGKYIVVQGQIPHWYLDATTLDTVAIDSGAGGGGAWDSTGNIFYSLRNRNGTTFIRRFDVSTNTALPEIAYVDDLIQGALASRVQPTTDPNKVYIYVYYTWNAGRVVSYDLTDSTSVRISGVRSRILDFAISPDWKKLLFTDAFTATEGGSQNVYFADIALDQLETIIPSPQNTDSSRLLNPSHVAITPDGKLAMVSGDEVWAQGLISMAERKYIKFLIPAWQSGYPWGVACATGKR